ncbi:MAG: DNA primase [Actinomycetaceae bacterium]|nr:DNA primase [Actinomycetaceae bacterium]
MTQLPGNARDALDKLYEAFERHYVTAHECDNIFDERVVDSEEALQDAFFVYDHVLFAETGMELPFDILDEDNEIHFVEHYDSTGLITNDDDFDEDEDDLEDYEDEDINDYEDDEYEVYDVDNNDASERVESNQVSLDNGDDTDNEIPT